MPDACVNGGVFRQDEQDTLRGDFDLPQAERIRIHNFALFACFAVIRSGFVVLCDIGMHRLHV